MSSVERSPPLLYGVHPRPGLIRHDVRKRPGVLFVVSGSPSERHDQVCCLWCLAAQVNVTTFHSARNDNAYRPPEQLPRSHRSRAETCVWPLLRDCSYRIGSENLTIAALSIVSSTSDRLLTATKRYRAHPPWQSPNCTDLAVCSCLGIQALDRAHHMHAPSSYLNA